MSAHWRFRFLVALPLVRDLLLCAKHLFVAARMPLEGPRKGALGVGWIFGILGERARFAHSERRLEFAYNRYRSTRRTQHNVCRL